MIGISSGSALEDEEEYLGDRETGSQQETDVEEFLRGLSTDDLDQLKKYVADDLSEEQTDAGEQSGVVRRLSEDDQSPDDVGELLIVL